MKRACGVAAVMLMACPAWADADTDAREGAMFDTAPVGELPELTTESRLASEVDENSNYLTIGGQFYLRYDWHAKEVGNWHNFPVTSPNLLDLYFDARPNERLRGYVRARTAYDPTVNPNTPAQPGVQQQQLQLLLDEFWLKFDIYRTAFVTVGRQLVRWGSGRFWNPTDFVNRVHRDPLAVFDQRVGVTLLKIDLPWESHNWNYYAVADLDNGAQLEEMDLIGRAEMLVGQTEFALSGAKRPDGSLQLGADISSGVGPFDMRFEASLQHGLTQLFYAGSNPLTAQPISRQDEWLLQVMGGADVSIKYTDDDAVILGVEYFYNQLGYDSADLFPLLLLKGAYSPLYFGRHYAAAYAQFSKPASLNNTTFIVSVLANLSDMSALSRGDWIVRVLTFMDFNAYVTYHFGNHGEFRYRLPESLEPLVPQGVSLATPVSEVGLGLRLYF